MRRALLPFLPDDPRRRRRRAYTTGGLSPISAPLMPQRVEERLPPITPQLAWRVAVLGGIAFVLFGDRLLPPLVPAGADGPGGRPLGARQPRAQGPIEAPRGDIVDRNNRRWCRRRSPPSCRSSRAAARQRARARRDYRKSLSAAEHERLLAAERYDASSASCATTAARSRKREQRKERRRSSRRPRRRRRSTCPPVAPAETDADRALPAHGPRPADHAEDDPEARDPRDRRRAVLQHHDPHRRRRARSSTTCASSRRSSPAWSWTSATCAVPARRARGAAVRDACCEIAPEQRKEKEYAASRRARGSARAGSSCSTTSSCAGPTATTKPVVDAFGSRDDQRRSRSRSRSRGSGSS